MRRLILWVPLAVFALIAVVAAVMLRTPSDASIPTQLVGKTMPDFSLPQAFPGRATVSRGDFEGGQPRVLNVFASWCGPCIVEAPQLMELARRGLTIDAVAIRDRPENVARFLAQWGDPFRNIGLDQNLDFQLTLGSGGVPETFIVDGRGAIRYQHIGPINANEVPRILQEYEAAKQ
jgi:cytochrome c biogenesis protein CcmG/thiol:disulfide interchange protein DsbE